VGIVGAGLSGLSTAFYLKRLRPQVELVIFEAGVRAGGTMQTHVIDGFHFEAGGNGFLTNKPDCLQLVRDSGLELELMPSSAEARKRYLFHDRLHRLPESPPAFLESTLLTWPQKLRVLAEPLIRARRDGYDETVREFGDRRLGAAFTSTFLDAMCAGIFGSTPDRLSVAAAFPLVVALEREHGGLMRGMLARRKRETGPGGVLTSFRGGLTALAMHLSTVIDAEWRWSSVVRRIERRGRGYRVFDDPAGTDLDAVAICAPAYAASSMLTELDPAIAERLRRIEYAPIAVVGFGYRAHPNAFDGFGVLTTTGSRQPILGVLWDSSVFPGRAPPGSKSLRVLIGGQRNPELAVQGESGLVRTARAGLAAVMGADPEPEVTFVHRWERGIPAYSRGHIENVDQVFDALARWPRLHLACNAYRGVAMNDCVRNGRLLAERIVAEAG